MPVVNFNVFGNKDGNVGIGNNAPTNKLHVTGTSLLSANVTLGAALVANSSAGSAGQVLHSNGTATYWAADDDTNTTYDLLTVANTVANEARVRLKDSANANDDILIIGANGITTFSNSTAGYAFAVGSSTVTVNTTGIHVNPVLSITDLTLAGNLTVLGDTVTLNVASVSIEDSLVEYARNQNVTTTFTDALDIGFYGSYGNTANSWSTGLFRDQSDSGIWKIFQSNGVVTNTTIDTANSSLFRLAPLEAASFGTTEAGYGSASGAALANATVVAVGNSSVNTVVSYGQSLFARPIASADFDAINIAYSGSWSSATNFVAGINVTDSSSTLTNTVGRFGITYNSQGFGAFVIKNLYNAGYTNTSTVFTATGGGNVGIGITNPAARLDLGVLSGGAVGFKMQDGWADIITSGSVVGSRYLYGSTVYGRLYSNVTGMNLDTAGAAVPLIFGTNGAERVRINTAGNVGIGTISPQAVLDLGAATNGRAITWGSDGTGRYASIFTAYSSSGLVLAGGFHGNTTADAYVSSHTGTYYNNGIKINTFGAQGIQFFTDASAARTAGAAFTPTERMRIDSSGRLLVAGTSSYSDAKIQLVNGDDATGANARAQIAFQFNGTGYTHYIASRHNSSASSDGNALVFYLNNSGAQGGSTAPGTGTVMSQFMGTQTHIWYTANAERMRINSAGNVGIGTTSPGYKLHVEGDFFVSQPAWGGFPLAPNLIHNSYMSKVTSNVPDGFSTTGLTIVAAHPYTAGFEGPYTPTAPVGSVNDPNLATETTPYWYGVYYKGPRIGRGGMADGWHSYGDGKILKVTGAGLTASSHCSVFMPKELNNLGAKWFFSAFVKIIKGTGFSYGTDAGYTGSAPNFVTKATIDAGAQGWLRVSGIVDTSQITSIDGLAFSMGIHPDANGDVEAYIALPYLANVNYKGTNLDSWSNSILDKLMRQGLYIEPVDFATEKVRITTAGNVGIGTTTPGVKLDVNGNVRIANGSYLYWFNHNSTTNGPYIGSSSDNLEISAGPTAAGRGALTLTGHNNTTLQTDAGILTLSASQTGTDQAQIRFSTAGSEKMRIANNGNVGIGTTSPTSIFHVVSGTNVLKFPQTDGGDVGLQIESQSSGHAPSVHLKNAAGYYRLAVHSSDGSFRAFNGSDRLTILQNGNVGIGNNAPTATLHVQGTTLFRSTGAAVTLDSASATDARMEFLYNGTRSGSISVDNSIFSVTANSAAVLTLGANAQERMRIAANGNVGIRNSSPSTILTVNAKVGDDNGVTYDSNTVYITHQTPTATAVLNDPKPILLLARQGTGGQAYGAAAEFNLSRYENSGTGSVGSRTRLDIKLAHDQFMSANTTVMTMRSDGNVGIGTTSPVGKLSVYTTSLNSDTDYNGQNFGLIIGKDNGENVNDDGNGIVFTQQYATDAVDSSQVRTGAIIGYKGQGVGSFGGGLKFKVQPAGANPMSTVMTLTKEGNVGIGTTAASQKLSVAGNVIVGTEGNTRLTLFGVGGGQSIREHYDVEVNPRWAIGRDFITGGQAGIGFVAVANGAFANVGAAVGTPGSSTLAFYTSNGIALAERTRITSDGNIGVGTTAPINFGSNYRSVHISATTAGALRVSDTGSTNVLDVFAGTLVPTIRAGSGSPLVLSANTAEAMRIAANGNVGIGTTSPNYPLTVAGQASFNGVPLSEAVNYDELTYFSLQKHLENNNTNAFIATTGTAPTYANNNNTSTPFSRIAVCTAFFEASGEFIPVQPGERLYGEIYARREIGAAGTDGSLYVGIARYDKDKNPIATNIGLDYFITTGSGVIVPKDSNWTKYSGYTTLPLSHTAFNGSDGGPVRYIRPYIIVNYPSGTITTFIGGFTIRKVAAVKDVGEFAVLGNFGVGTNSPTSFGAGYTTLTTLGGTAAVIEARGTSSSSILRLQADNAFGMVDMTSNHPLVLRTNATERMRITAAGNVGIGSNSPASKLHVFGGPIDSGGAAGNWVIRAFDLTAMNTNVGGSILFQGYKTAAGATGNFAAIAGLKENNTDANESGYLALYTVPNATQLITERMRISSDGDVLIGGTTTTGYSAGYSSLVIGSTSKVGLIKFRSSYNSGNGAEIYQTTGGVTYFATNSTTPWMISDSSGNVNIGGGTTPLSKLQISTTSGESPVNGSGGAIRLRSTATAGVAVGPSIIFEGQTNNTTTNYGFAAIQGFKASSTAEDYTGSLAFYTQNSGGASSFNERMRITTTGVIIGNGETNASPVNALIRATDGSGTNIAGASFTVQGGRSTGNAAGGPIIFSTAAASGTSGTALNAATERMRINSAGNVGIGVDPSHRLHVSGNALVSGVIYNNSIADLGGNQKFSWTSGAGQNIIYYGALYGSGTETFLASSDSSVGRGSLILGDGFNIDALAFISPSSVEYSDGTTWTAGTVNSTVQNLFMGKHVTNFGTLSLPTNQAGVRFTWTSSQISMYQFINSLMISHSTQGNTVYALLEYSIDAGVNWVTQIQSTTFGSWPGYSTVHAIGNTPSNANRIRLSIIRSGASSGNPILIGQISMLGSYGTNSTNKLFDWDFSRNISMPNGLYATGSIRTTQSVTIGNSAGTYQAGSIYSDGNWGMIFRAAQASPATAQFAWKSSDDAAEYMRITATGNVAIGQTTSAVKFTASSSNPTRGIVQIITNPAASAWTGAQLQFTQSGLADWVVGQPAATDAFAIWSGRSVSADGTERMRIDSAGNVGIGSTSPAAKLEVKAATDNQNPIFQVTEYRAGGAALAKIYESQDAGIMSIGYYGLTTSRVDINGGSSGGASNIYMYNGASANVVLTASGSSYFTGGNVGVGTTAPQGILQTAGSGDQNIYFSHNDNVAGRTVSLWLGTNNDTYKNRSTYVRAIEGAGVDSYSLTFGTTAPTDTSTQERLRITPAGNVGVITGQLYLPATSSRSKIDLYGGSSVYNIGMQSGVTFGGLQDWAMTFQFNNETDRGFWWGHDAHTVAQGAMALTTDGRLTVAKSIRLGFGESDSIDPGTNYTLEVNGSLAATTKSFVIDHPTKPNHKLRYGSLESPYHGVRLTGEAEVVDGICTVKLPDYIHALCHSEGVNVQLTNIKHGKVLWVDEIDIDNNEFTVATETNGNYKFYWSFTAIRKDIEDMIVEFESE